MPRNASGVYTLPAGNPVVPGTTIDAAWANDTLEDLANEVTNSLSRTGAGGMLAPFRLADGTVTAPGVAWLNETNSGLYRSGAGSTWMSILGVNTAQFSTVGLTIPFGKALTAQGNASVGGTLAVTGAATFGSTLALTGALTATGGVLGNVTGNVTAASGTSTFNDVVITGSLDMTAGSSATITGLSTPTNASDAANKGYVDAQVATRLAIAGGSMWGPIEMQNFKVTGVATPTADQDAANKAYVDTVAQGLDAKASCVLATTTNITLSGVQTVDGFSADTNDRILVKNQTNAAENGIYAANPSGAWTRTADANTYQELIAAFTFIERGNTNANSGWVCTIPPSGTLGVTSITWAQFSGAGQIDAGTGMSKSGNTLNVNTASSARIVVGADNIDLATTGVTGGTYRSVTVDAYGRVTAGTNPTTIAGYGITDAYTTTQVDTLVNARLSLTGGTMSGAIAMGANKITGMADPTNPQDAATKSYIDTIFGSTTTAAASAAAAAASATAAAGSATSASNSATAAAGSATSAANSYTTFNNQYLGSKTSDPSTNNSGGALVAGNLYWNSTVSEMRVYTGSAWLTAYLPATGYLALSGGTMTGTITFAAGQTIAGYATTANPTFTGLIGGDFSNATASSRVAFQSTTTNGSTIVAARPNGTGTASYLQVFNSSGVDNAAYGYMGITTTALSFNSNKTGSGTALPITFATSAGEVARATTGGNWLIGSSTDNGTDKLQVTGSMSLSSALRVGATPSAGTSGQVLTSAGAGAAPVWAAPPASAGSITAVASGTLPDGSTVVINSDGTVSAVSGSYSSSLTFGSATYLGGSYAMTALASAYDSVNQKVVIAFRDSASSNYGKAIVGSVSGSTITFGSPTTFFAGNAPNIAMAYDTNAQKVFIAYRDVPNGGYGAAVVGVVSGTSISFPSGPSNFTSTATVIDIACVYHPVQQKILVAYQDSGAGGGQAKVITISGTTFTAGSAETVASGGMGYTTACYDSNTQKIVVSYQKYSNGQGTSRVATISGTTVTFGSEVSWTPGVAAVFLSSAYDPVNQKVVVAYQDQTNSSVGKAVVGTVSGTSISLGSPVTFHSSTTSYVQSVYDAVSGQIVVYFSDGSSYPSYVVGTVSGTTTSWTAKTNIASTGSNSNTVVSLQDGKLVFTGGASWYSSVVGEFAITTNLTAENFIGFSSATYTNGQTATVNTVGSADDSQSGLTAGQMYYVGPTGTLSLTPASPSVFAGTALSATKILVKG